jgi:uncharacterized protein (DUF697 family)
MAKQRSTIGHNPLAAVAAAEPMDAGSADHVVPVAPGGGAASAEWADPAKGAPVGTAPAEAHAGTAAPEAAPPAEPAEAPAAAGTAEALAEPDDLPAPEDAATEPVEDAAVRRRKAQRIVRRQLAWSAAAGLLPIPVLDVAGSIAAQVQMLQAMARLYGIAFDRSLARQLVVAVVGGGGPVVLAVPVASAAKAVPVVGTLAGLLLTPAVASLSCHVVGRAFLKHFEAGGTLETFDPEQVRAEVIAP